MLRIKRCMRIWVNVSCSVENFELSVRQEKSYSNSSLFVGMWGIYCPKLLARMYDTVHIWSELVF